MIYGLWQSAAGLQAQEYRQAVIANNLANAETPVSSLIALPFKSV